MEVLRSLTSSDRSVNDVLRGLDIVRTLLRNIIQAPTDEKYRRIRKTNPRIASLLGLEEEGLLRAAGFQDAEEDTLVCMCGSSDCLSSSGVCGEGASVVKDSLAIITAVHSSIEVACSAFRKALEDMAASTFALDSSDLALDMQSSPPDPMCRERSMSQALECALLDLVTQWSADQAEVEKRRRRSSEAEVIRSLDWHAAMENAGGSFLFDSSIVEAWLSADPAHRTLAYDLIVLQADSMRWYGCGARRHCEEWRSNLALNVKKDAPPPACCQAVFEEELKLLRDAMFEYPEQPGAAPAIFRKITLPTNDASDCIALEVPTELAALGTSVQAVQVE